MNRDFNPLEPELMDRPQPVSDALKTDLRNLESLNRHFGSHRIVRHFLAQWLTPGETCRVLDLATGAGDLPRVMVDWARAHDVSLRVDALDANPATLEIARGWAKYYPEVNFLRGNALSYESGETYDLVHCSLALHHFSEEDAIRLLRVCRTLSHRFVLVADLERSLVTTIGVELLTGLFYREPMTRSDALTSARRAFSFGELRALAEQAGWTDFGHARFLFCRQVLWLDGRDPAVIPPIAVVDNGQLPCPAA